MYVLVEKYGRGFVLHLISVKSFPRIIKNDRCRELYVYESQTSLITDKLIFSISAINFVFVKRKMYSDILI